MFNFFDLMDHSLPGSSVYGVLQARILEWVAMLFSRESSRPRDWIQVSRIAGRYFTIWATWEALRVMSSAYLRLLIFLPAILIQACASSSLAFCMMYSICKLNNQGDNIQPSCIPFPTWNQPVPCPVLNVASWPACRFLRRQVRWSGITISLWIFHNLLWSTQSKALA